MFQSILTGKFGSFRKCSLEFVWLIVDNRIVATAQQAQHPDGGFGGGPGQFSHSATSYAMVLALINAGGEEALQVIDRKKM